MKQFSLTIILLLFLSRVGSATARPVTILPAVGPADRAQPTGAGTDSIVPRRATVRSLILPGWGQFYNRQYWKISVIYGGLGVAIATFTWNQHLYDQYVTGYREAYLSATPNPLFGTKTAIVRGEVRTVAYLKGATDRFRRQRDLTVILTVVGWALNAVEANVAAHLSTFDVSDDLSLKITPTLLPAPGPGLVPGIRLVMCIR